MKNLNKFFNISILCCLCCLYVSCGNGDGSKESGSLSNGSLEYLIPRDVESVTGTWKEDGKRSFKFNEVGSNKRIKLEELAANLKNDESYIKFYENNTFEDFSYYQDFQISSKSDEVEAIKGMWVHNKGRYSYDNETKDILIEVESSLGYYHGMLFDVEYAGDKYGSYKVNGYINPISIGFYNN